MLDLNNKSILITGGTVRLEKPCKKDFKRLARY
jgi:hypothetical protein